MQILHFEAQPIAPYLHYILATYTAAFLRIYERRARYKTELQ